MTSKLLVWVCAWALVLGGAESAWAQGEPPAEEAPAEETPEEEVPQEEPPAEEVPQEEPPAEEVPVAEEEAQPEPPAYWQAPLDSKDGKQLRRERPRYDGRTPRPIDPASAAAWVPRVLLAPLYAVSEYVIRIPVGALATGLEKGRVIDKVRHVLSFGSAGKSMIYPTALIDFGFRPSIGLSFFANDFPAKNSKLRAQFAWGGRDWWLLSLRERFFFGPGPELNTPLAGSHISLRFGYLSRPDWIFYGYGPDSGGTVTRFRHERLGGGVGAELVFGDLDGLTIDVAVERHRLGPGHPNDKRGELSIQQRFNTLSESAIPGWGGYTLLTGDIGLSLDSRQARPAGGSGVRLELGAEINGDLQDTDNWFLHLRGEVGVAIDFNDHDRVLAISHNVQLIEPLTGELVPMPEQIALGGQELLRGFLGGRFRGMSSWVTSMRYSYPIWAFLDGLLFVETGNVFGTNLAGFHPEKWAMSFGMGVRTNSDRDAAFSVMVAAGTTTFGAERFKVDSFRLVIGNDRGL